MDITWEHSGITCTLYFAEWKAFAWAIDQQLAINYPCISAALRPLMVHWGQHCRTKEWNSSVSSIKQARTAHRKHLNLKEIILSYLPAKQSSAREMPLSYCIDRGPEPPSFFSSALCYCTAELLSSRRRPSSVRPSSVKPVCSEPVKQINAKFGGKVPFYHIPRPFFFRNFAFFIFFTIYFRFR